MVVALLLAFGIVIALIGGLLLIAASNLSALGLYVVGLFVLVAGLVLAVCAGDLEQQHHHDTQVRNASQNCQQQGLRVTVVSHDVVICTSDGVKVKVVQP